MNLNGLEIPLIPTRLATYTKCGVLITFQASGEKWRAMWRSLHPPQHWNHEEMVNNMQVC